MIGMTKALAHEVASRGITANCVAPGFIESAMTEGLPESRKQTILGSVPLGRLGKPEEIAGCIIFSSATRDRTSPARRCTSTAV